MSDEWNWKGEPQSAASGHTGTSSDAPQENTWQETLSGTEAHSSSACSEKNSDVTYHYKFERGGQNTYHYDKPVRGDSSGEGAFRQEGQKAQLGYAHYELHQGKDEKGEEDASSKKIEKTEKNEKTRKTEKTFGRKAGSAVTLGLIFGLAAGAAFQGVNLISKKYLIASPQTWVDTTETVPDEASDAKEDSLFDVVSKSGTVAGVAQATMPCVVAITSVSIQEFQSFFGYGMEYPSTGSGSGIIVGENDEELLIATNNHVVEGATTLNVCFIGDDVVSAEQETKSFLSGDGDINIEDAVSAKIKGTDDENDLAVIAVKKSDIPDDTMSEIKIAQLGDSDELVVGEQVVAIGNALGYGQTVTSGWVSALDRTVKLESGSASDLIQTDAAINPGNSGGALLNMRGELIGINCAKYAGNTVEGTGYAIPISKAQPILEELMNRKTRDKVEDQSQAGYLGVQVADLSVEAVQMYNMPSGAFVIEVNRAEAAELAGIQRNDIIVKLDGQKVSSKADLAEKLQYYTAGEEVDVVVARADSGKYKEEILTVTLGARPD